MKIFKQQFKIRDSIHIEIQDKYGNVKSSRTINEGFFRRILIRLGLAHNSMTLTGFAATTALLGNVTPPAAFTKIGIGTGTGAAGEANTKLGTPIKLKAATVTQEDLGGHTHNVLQLVATFSAALDTISGTDSITEVGVHNGTNNDTAICLLRQVYTPADVLNWDQGDQMIVTVTIEVKQGA